MGLFAAFRVFNTYTGWKKITYVFEDNWWNPPLSTLSFTEMSAIECVYLLL